MQNWFSGSFIHVVRTNIFSSGWTGVWKQKKMMRSLHSAQHENKCYCRQRVCDYFDVDVSRENANQRDCNLRRGNVAPSQYSFASMNEALFALASDDAAIDHFDFNDSQNRW